MIRTFTPILKSFSILFLLLLISSQVMGQSQFQTGNGNKKKTEQKQALAKKAAVKVDVKSLRKTRYQQKYPKEYELQSKAGQSGESGENVAAVTNSYPTLKQATIGIQQGAKYNLKKVINNEEGKSLFSKRTDNPGLRAEYNNKRLRNPKTGLIPEGIRERELKYVRSSSSGMQNNPLLIKSSSINIPNAPGDQTSPWVNRGPFNVGGRTRALAIDIADEDRILAGGVSGGLWESTDQGATWTRITPAQEHPSITDIAQDPNNLNVWYYSTGERLGASQSGRNGSAFFQGNGIYISTDNAQTFTPLPATTNPTPETFSAAEPFDLNFGIAINPVNSDLYVATFAGIYRTTNGGTSFEEVIPSDFDNFTDIHITATGVLYATVDSGAGAAGTASGIFRSTDGAAGTWVNITDAAFPAAFGRTVVYTAPSNENVLYLYAAGTTSAPIGHDFWKYTYISGDGTGAGGTWENRTNNIPNFGGPVGDADTQGGYDIYVRVHPNDEDIVFLGGLNIFRSFDGFATPIQQTNSGWIAGYSPLNNVSLYTNHHPDQHSLEFFPSNPDMVISGHDGGLSITNDILATAPAGSIEPVAWTSLNNGYLTTQVYALSIGPTDQIMAGFQDNSTWFTSTTNPQADWTDLFSGDGSYNAFNDDGTIRYVSAQNGQAFRITYPDANSTAATSFQNIQPAGAVGFLFVNPFELDPNDDELMYFAAGATLWRNDDLTNATQTVGWTSLTNAISPGGTISAIGISSNPANIVYYGTTTGSLVRIDNANTGNPTGINVSSGLPGGNVSSIAVDPFNPNNVYVTLSNYSIPSVFFSNDGGSTWADISGNLEVNPDGSGAGPSVRWINIVGNSDLFLVGTSTGLFGTSTLNGASTVWNQVDPNGIGNVVVEQIRSRADGLVVAGTHGNGLYSASFEVSQPAVVVDTPLADVNLEANDADVQLNVENVFASNETPPLSITVSVDNNSDPSIVTTNITGNTLTLSLVPDAFGTAIITLRGEDSNGAFATSSFNVNVGPPPLSTFPLIVDFETGALPIGWEISGVLPWVINSGGTPSGSTGPLGDNTQSDGSGFYAYTEATGSNPGDQGVILSREIDLTSLTSPVMDIFYHMFGAGIGSLDVEVIDITNGGTVSSVFSISGPQQAAQADPYISEFSIDLSAFASSIIQLRFVGTRGDDFTSDIAIDDIRVFERPANDLGVTAIEVSADPFFSSAETVTVTVTNYGTDAQSNFPISYILDGGTQVDETFTQTVAANSTATYSFTTQADLSASGPHTITSFTGLIGDGNALNDSFTENFNTVPIIAAFPYVEDFESVTGALPAGWIAEGTLPWLLNSGDTPSGGTGPSADNTIGDATGTYIFTETSGFALDDTGSFTTGAFDISSLTAPTLEFFYHMFGGDIGQLDVEVLNLTNSTTTTVFTVQGPQQVAQSDPYIRGRVDLSSFSGNTIQLRFVSTRGDGFESDIAVDDISIFQLPDADLTLSAVNTTPLTLIGSPTDVIVEITNSGALAQSNFDVGYQLSGEAAVTETFTATIQPGETATYTFNTPVTVGLNGVYTFDAFTQLTGDANTSDDLLQFEGLSLVGSSIFPYQESFETGNDGWFSTGINNSFELGTPANTIIDAASDGTQAWVTNLTGAYNINEQSFVIGPLFDFTNITDPVIFLDINYDIEANFDGAVLQSSIDNGVSWQNVGELGDVPNWFNLANLGSLSFAGTSTDSWSGSSGGFVTAVNTLDGLEGESAVALRVVFGSDGSVTQEGFAFDNVRIVSDQDLLQITCVDDITVSNDPGVCEAALTIPQPTFVNQVGNVTITNSINSDVNADITASFEAGLTTEVVWTVTDESGIVRTCTLNVTVNDTEAPEITGDVLDVTIEAPAGSTAAIYNYDVAVSENCDLEKQITQSGNQTLVAANFVVCPPGPNSYLRVFDLATFGVDRDFPVTSLEFGIEESIALNGQLPQVTANIYLYDPTTPLLFENFTLLASQSAEVPEGNLLLLNVPFENTTIPAGSTVVIELFTASGNDGATPTLTMVGQPLGATGISYLASTACGVDEPTDVDAVGLGDIDADWVINLNGGSNGLVQTAGLPSGSEFPIGVTTNTFEVTDLAGNTTSVSFDVEVLNSDFLLPDNIQLETVSETCPGLDNGTINITVSETQFEYVATVSGNGQDLNQTFNETASFEDLPVGDYTVTVSIADRGFNQQFNISIDPAAELDIDFDGVLPEAGRQNTYNVNINSGTGPFDVRLNGKLLRTTNERSFSIEVNESGVLEIQSSRLCEGIFATTIDLGFDDLVAFPNPVIDDLSITMPRANVNDVPVRIFSITGQEVFNQNITIRNSILRVPFRTLPNGTYFVRLEMESPVVLKIIK